MSPILRNTLRHLYPIAYRLFHALHRLLITPINRLRNSRKPERKLEIGPGRTRIFGFETLNVAAGLNVDYVCNATQPLPFKTGTFNLVHASHVLEHMPWYSSLEVLREWVRILKPGGIIEIWVPDGYKLCKLLGDVEEGKTRQEWQDEWRPFNPNNDPYRWVNGRLLYGVRNDYPSWHQAIFTPNSLRQMFENLGLVDIQQLEPHQTRSVDHGWINLGFRGKRP